MFNAQLLGCVLLWSLLIGCVAPGGVARDRSPLTLQQTTGVKVHTGGRLMLPCGNQTHTGMVQYWHTPFGQVQNDRSHGNKDDPVEMKSDGSLKINTITQHHVGLYYCLLQDTDGITLHPYRLHTLPDQHDHSRPHLDRKERGQPPDRVVPPLLIQAQSSGGQQTPAARPPRSVEGQCEEEEEEGRSGSTVSDGQFAGAVVASVLVTFLVGFSSGALSRAPLLRCVRGTRDKMRSVGRRRRQTTVPDHRTQVTMETLPSPTTDGESSLTTAPPAKPQRSFRRGKGEGPEAASYLEGCDHSGREADGRRDGREEREEQRDRGGETGGEEEEEGGGSGPGGRYSGGGASGAEEAGLQPDEEGGDQEEKPDGVDDEGACSRPRPARRSRVIRLYQYDEEGHRYGHLTDSSPSETGPAPRSKQRSLSLTRLNAIMATAGASLLDPPGRDASEERDAGEGGGASSEQERPVFKMDI